MIRRSLFLLSLFFIATGACATETPAEEGIIRGDVTIGPLVPVLREGEDPPTPSPEVFAERKVLIYDADGEKLIQEVDIQSPGHYEVSLPAGVYTLDINHLGIDSAEGLPTTVTIEVDHTLELNIDIDTGIR